MSDVVLIPISQLPSSIKTTHLYSILHKKYSKKGRDIEIPIPSAVYKKELVLSTVYDMIPTVESLYQLTGSIDYKHYDFIFENRDIIRPCLQSLKQLYPDNFFLGEINLLLEPISPSLLLLEIIENDYVDLLKYCVSKHLVDIAYENLSTLLARKGKQKCIKYLHSAGINFDKRVLDTAIKYQNETCIDYIVFYTDVE